MELNVTQQTLGGDVTRLWLRMCSACDVRAINRCKMRFNH